MTGRWIKETNIELIGGLDKKIKGVGKAMFTDTAENFPEIEEV